MPVPQAIPAEEAEASLVQRAAAGEAAAVRLIIKAHNQRLYRLVRAVLRSNADAEDVLQEAYLKAFALVDVADPQHRLLTLKLIEAGGTPPHSEDKT